MEASEMPRDLCRAGDAIVFNDVSFSYSNGFALSELSFTIRSGELALIMGPNGSGKTTVLKLMAGILKPSSGDVYLCGINTKRVKLSEVAKYVGYVPQNPWMAFFNNTVFNEIAYVARNIGLSKEEYEARVLEVSTWLNIAHLLQRSPHSLSEGEARRVSIAAAVTHDPSIVLLDEPTAGLDYLNKVDYVNIVQKAVLRRGRTVVMSSHDIDLLTLFPEAKVILLNNGRLSFNGYIRDLLSRAHLLLSNKLLPPAAIALSTYLNELLGIGAEGREASVEELIERTVLRKDVIGELICS
ncbi:MAG: energy-coupling factor ABC transporter ATP-binding protein [Sulfolobales archaeon]|nr:energy-coupling factor ABC transporter ATP-binding protein [Sulfolobales archaeon]